MDILWWQILLLTIYAGIQILDNLSFGFLAQPVMAGLISGLVMGDVTTGLMIGGGMQLTILGVGTFGGASHIDANSGTVLAVAFSVAIGMNPEQALATLGVPVASLMIQTDILARFTNTFFAHRIDSKIEKMDYRGIERNYLYGAIPWSLSRAVPVFLALTFGSNIVKPVVNYLNTDLKWLGDGLTLAGALLPAVGFAILLKYLPLKRHYPYFILGFIITALFVTIFGGLTTLGTSVAGLDKNFTDAMGPLPMLAVALIGFSLAAMAYQRSTQTTPRYEGQQRQQSNVDDEGEIEDDEL
ncbi:TPA: PTS mannose/fructose/sorbose/N-acetylgalactosamine transporter subunit IIC [Staphylococcus pseudintermedius]